MTLFFCNIFILFFTPCNSPRTQQTACVPTDQLMDLFYSSGYKDILTPSLLQINSSRKYNYAIVNCNTRGLSSTKWVNLPPSINTVFQHRLRTTAFLFLSIRQVKLFLIKSKNFRVSYKCVDYTQIKGLYRQPGLTAKHRRIVIVFSVYCRLTPWFMLPYSLCHCRVKILRWFIPNPNIYIIQLRLRMAHSISRPAMKISLTLSIIIVPVTTIITSVIWFYDLLILPSVSLLSPLCQRPGLSISAIWTQ